MPNRNLNEAQLRQARKLLNSIRRRLVKLSGGRKSLLFAYRRKIAKELSYDERSKPVQRRKLKKQKFQQQKGLCAQCRRKLPASYTVLDRMRAVDGYTAKNTRLICEKCDKQAQHWRKYK